MHLKTCVFIPLLFSSTFGDDIDMDYYYSSGLRTRTILACRSRLSQLQCQIKCDMKTALCIRDECYCMSIIKENGHEAQSTSISVKNKKRKQKNVIEDYVDFESYKQPDVVPLEIESLYALRPTVRHHIAHFCPNLDVARTCIRKCMEQGKPAFCGKDHVCYCGHKYTHTGKDDGGDAKNIYAQFKDLYKKYFGPGYEKGSVEV